MNPGSPRNSVPPKPSVFDFADYRAYLQHYYSWAKQHKRGFSHRAFLAKAEMSGPNYLKKVMEGVHSLTESSAQHFSKALDHNPEEQQFFLTLIHFCETKKLVDKDRYFEVLMHLKSPQSSWRLREKQYAYFKDWSYVAIRELLSCFSKMPDSDRMGKMLMPPISGKKIEQAIECLHQLDLIRKDSNGNWKLEKQHVSTGPEGDSFFVPLFHKKMAQLGTESITSFSKAERNISGIAMSISKQSYHDIVALIAQARKEIIDLSMAASHPERVYHLNLQLFPLTRTKALRKRKRK